MPAPEDKLLLQESDVPEKSGSPVDRPVEHRASDLAHGPARARPRLHEPAHGGGRAVPGGGSSAHGDLLRLAVELPKGTRLNLQGKPPGPRKPRCYHQIDLAKEALAVDGFPVYEVDGFEGDDLIATATRLLTATRERAVLIASADKDLLALVSDRVEVHSTRTGKRIGPDEVLEKLGVGPGLVVDYLTLVGDASDNIKGAKGIGPKTAAELLTYFGSLRWVVQRNRRRQREHPQTGPARKPQRVEPAP